LLSAFRPIRPGRVAGFGRILGLRLFFGRTAAAVTAFSMAPFAVPEQVHGTHPANQQNQKPVLTQPLHESFSLILKPD
jgi:hypothetical protein